MKKQQKHTLRFLVLSLILVLALTACGGRNAEETEDPNAAVTHVVETAMAAITQTAAVQSPTPSSTPTVEPTATNTPVPTILTSPTIPAIATSTSVFNQPGGTTSSCDIGNFVKDVTIPDGTSMAAGTTFTKTWEIKNAGTCTWNENYVIIFYGGEQMAEEASYQLTDEDVEPGESLQVSIEMTAPATTGSYTSYWILRNDAGQNFFVDGGSIYAQISVGGTATPGPTSEPNEAPTVDINSPSPAPPYTPSTSIKLSATAYDAEDGDDFTNIITWTSSKDGFLGTGKSINTTLSEGDHTITAEVEDSGNKKGSATINISVEGP